MARKRKTKSKPKATTRPAKTAIAKNVEELKAPPPPPTVVLENRERRMMVFNLPHDKWCEVVGECSCGPERKVILYVHDPKTGAKLPREVMLKAPGSFSIRHKRKVRMHEAVLSLPGVQRAVDLRQLRVHR